MENKQLIKKSKAIKNTPAINPAREEAKETPDFGINLTVDNSLKKYATDAFILEQAEKVDRKFAKK